jgi:hypothetical protein
MPPWPGGETQYVQNISRAGQRGWSNGFKLVNAAFTVLPFAKRFYLKREWLNTGLHKGRTK